MNSRRFMRLTQSGIVLVLAGLVSVKALLAAELTPATVKAWEAYVASTENRIRRELAQGGQYLSSDFQPARAASADRQAMLSGRIVIAKMESRDGNGKAIDVPDGMIHHWRGGMFVPGVDLAHVLERVENPAPQEIKQEDVLQSEVLGRGEGYLKLYLKLQRSKIVTVVYNTVHEIRYERFPRNRAWSNSRTLKIAEVSHPNSPAEQEKPEGIDHGFLWRLNSYWRYEEVPGGVFVECESLSLSRSVPSFLEFMIRPIIDRVARESMARTLSSMRDRLLFSTAKSPRHQA